MVNTNDGFTGVDVGDVIAYEASGGTMVTHRVVGIDAEGVKTKGDANEVEDMAAVHEENYIGKTFLSVPYLGYFAGFMKTRKGIILAATFIALILIAGIASDGLKKIIPDDGKSSEGGAVINNKEGS